MKVTVGFLLSVVIGLLPAAIVRADDLAELPPGHSVRPKSFDFQTVRKKDLAIFFKPIPDVPVTTLPPGHSMKENTFDFQTMPEYNYQFPNWELPFEQQYHGGYCPSGISFQW